jgi:head-tail adaptor
MRAGLLTERIDVLKPVVTVNDYGEETTDWQNIYTTKARLVHTGGNRMNVNDEIFYSYTKTFQIRNYVPV